MDNASVLISKLMRKGKIKEVAKYVFYRDIEVGKKVVDYLAELKTEETKEMLIEALLYGVAYHTAARIPDENMLETIVTGLENRYIFDTNTNDYFAMDYTNKERLYIFGDEKIWFVTEEILQKIESSLIEIGEESDFIVKKMNELLSNKLKEVIEIEYFSSDDFEIYHSPILKRLGRVIGEIGNTEAIKPLVGMIKRTPWLVYDVEIILKKFGKKIITHLMRELDEGRINGDDYGSSKYRKGSHTYVKETLLLFLDKPSLKSIINNRHNYGDETRTLAIKRLEKLKS